MPTVSWYVKRIKTMSPTEIGWRLSSLSQAMIERGRVQLGFIPEAKFLPAYEPESVFKPGFNVFIGKPEEFSEQWLAPLVFKANKILDHRISYFDLQDLHLETPINWHKDHASGQVAGLDPILAVNYRDFSKNGDCKLVWEPNRHHQLVVLARAYKITGQLKYAQGVIDQLTSWLDANPYGRGMNWRSPLELAIRLISWVWAIDLIRDSGLFSGEFRKYLLNSVYLHCRDVSGKFSRGSSANNHLIGEAAGVYIAASYFNMLADAAAWGQKSKSVLEREIQAQTFADGCTKEHAFSYQFFVFQFYLLTSLVGQWQQDDFSPAYSLTLKKITEFIAAVAQGGSDYPMLGDQDDGYVLDLGDHVHDINALCDIAAHLYDDPIFTHGYYKPSETTFWLFGNRISRRHQVMSENVTLVPRHFVDSGYFLLQAGSKDDKDQASILFDCAELGYTAIAAHGHADALSLVMRLNGLDLLIDSGTYDYFSYPKWRDHFRKTRAHNALEVDGLDQSVMTGPFMWEQHARARCTLWHPGEHGGKVVAEHSGYQRLISPVTHQRSLELNTRCKRLAIVDRISTQGNHAIALYFHLSEYCSAIEIEQGVCKLILGENTVQITLPDNLTVEVITGQSGGDPGESSLGWLSRGYHQRTPITTLILRAEVQGDSEFKTQISWS